MVLPVTATYTAIFALMMVPLSMAVSLHYVRTGTSHEQHVVMHDEPLRRKTRAHGNFTEYVPLALILLGVLEVSGAAANKVWWLGAAFLLGRVLHAVGQLFTSTPALRASAMLLTHFAFVVGAINLLMLTYRGQA